MRDLRHSAMITMEAITLWVHLWPEKLCTTVDHEDIFSRFEILSFINDIVVNKKEMISRDTMVINSSVFEIFSNGVLSFEFHA